MLTVNMDYLNKTMDYLIEYKDYLIWIVLSVLVFIVAIWKFILKKDLEENRRLLQSEHAESLAKIEKERVSVQAKIAEEQRQAKEQNQKDREHAQAQIALERQFHQEKIDAAKKAIEAQKQNLQVLFREARQDHPELASAIADVQYRLDTNVIDYLLHKQRPAIKAAEEIRKLASEKRDLVKENRQLQYQLDFYEKLFPWLEEFKEVPTAEAVSYATEAYSTEYDAVKNWLSPEEYETLSSAQKYQLALDRWEHRKKSDWDIGIEYERYTGYRLECEGYKVRYIGASLGLKDMGRDLLAVKDGTTLIIQCKRWAKEKTIHEKHLFQLYGSTAVYAIEHPNENCKAVFVTTTALSDIAKQCADYCGITVVENFPIGKYPLIKCNANRDGEKIYHLPFDQQYDKVMVFKNNQSCYAWTTFEAERLGFRRAYRWHPNKD